MFDPVEAAAHFVRRGFLSPTELETAGTTLCRVPGRNLLYRTALDGPVPLLLKCAVDDETRRGLERESNAYDLIALCAGRGYAPNAPRKLDYDPQSSTLVIEFLPGHRSLRNRATELDVGLATALGRLVARVPCLPSPTGGSRPPWILSLVRPPIGILREATREQLELVERVQRSSIWREALNCLAEEWRPRSFVHGDLRFSNVLVSDYPGPGGDPALMLIDWELAGPGDPGWDAGWVVAEILTSRLRDLEDALPLLRAFWTGYTEGAREVANHAGLDSTIRWAVAASLQIAFERAGPSRQEISVRKLLEVGRSLLERPNVWIERVFSRAGG